MRTNVVQAILLSSYYRVHSFDKPHDAQMSSNVHQLERDMEGCTHAHLGTRARLAGPAPIGMAITQCMSVAWHRVCACMAPCIMG